MGIANAIIVMGVSGSGKSTVGLVLSETLGWPFFDGDDFHPPENVTKMSKGIPLNDADRQSWLATLHELIREHLKAGKSMVLACSALKHIYRQQLAEDNPGAKFVFLEGDYDLIFKRMRGRLGHYMRANMLQSQFEDLERPTEAIFVGVDQDVNAIVDEILVKLVPVLGRNITPD